MPPNEVPSSSEVAPPTDASEQQPPADDAIGDDGASEEPTTSAGPISWEDALLIAEDKLGLSGDDDDDSDSDGASATKAESSEDTGDDEGSAARNALDTKTDDGNGEEPQPPAAEAEPAQTQQEPDNAFDELSAELDIFEKPYSELTPEQRRVYDQSIERARERVQWEQDVYQRYLEMEELFASDKEAFFAQYGSKQLGALEEARAYYEKHGTPANAQGKPEAQVRQQVNNEWRTAVQETIKQAATAHGITEERFAELAKAAGKKSGQLMQATIAEAVEQGIQSRLPAEREKIAKAEREAAEKAADARVASVKGPRYPTGSGRQADPGSAAEQRRQDSGPITWEKALERAEKRLEEANV